MQKKYFFKLKKINKKSLFFSAGTSISYISTYCLKQSLSGLEFAVSIPGTLGGAIYMNAGAFDNEMKNILHKVYVLDIITLKTFWIDNSKCDFSYRHSIFHNDNNLIILGAILNLQIADSEYIKQKMLKFISIRKSTQNIKYPSAGSVFKRKKNFIPAKFLDENGFKGTRVGDAQLSHAHSGYIVNLGNATSQDVLNLIDFLSKRVLQISNNVLELEIKFIGD
jgi:UDP-N-acetylmuramate dehydrogenase